MFCSKTTTFARDAFLVRFGDTAANTGTLALLDSHPKTKDLPILTKTLCASGVAAS